MTRVARVSLLVVAIAVALAAMPLAQGRAGGPAPQNPAVPQNPNVAPSEAGTGAISGVVIDGTTKAPVAGAIVYLGPPSHGPPDTPFRTLTDARGRFVFRDLPAFGNYFLQASKFGYFTGSYGRGTTFAFGGRIALVDGQWFPDANITIWRPGAITGRVIDQTGEPVVGVFVRVLPRVLVAGKPNLAAGTVATTDDRGVYRVSGLEAGVYVVQVPSVQSSLPSSMAMGTGGSAAIDEGRPVASRDPMMESGGFRVQVGRYLTPLAPINGRTAVYPPTFYPNATALSEATVIDLKRAEERTGVDVQLAPVPSFTIAGRVDGPAEALASLTLRLLPPGLEDLGDGSETATALVGKDGSYAFLNVPPGTYVLMARRSVTQYEIANILSLSKELPRPPTPNSGGGMSAYGVFSGPSGLMISSSYSSEGSDRYSARMPVSVGSRDITDLLVTLRPSVRMTGTYVWAEGEGPDPNAPPRPGMNVRAALFPAGGSASLGLPRSTSSATPGSFAVDGLMAGEYVLDFSAGGGRVKSVTWKGRDYTYTPFDASSGEDISGVIVTLTNKGIVLTGAVLDGRGLPAEGAVVIVYPVEREQWSNYGFQPERLKTVTTTNLGAFRFQSLPAGDYFAIAVGPDQVDGWKDPAFLDRASRAATRLTVTWGENKSLDLRLTAIK
jgi:hypothetical protein